MKKIMFNDKYDLTESVLKGRKIQTRRVSNSPKYKVGEIVAIAQSYHAIYGDAVGSDIDKLKESSGWNNKMFVKSDLMPHRIIITYVGHQRLQDISDNDCLKEAIEFDHKAQSFYSGTNGKNWLGKTPREAFGVLIDKTSGKGTWEKNPYVWVYEFKLIK